MTDGAKPATRKSLAKEEALKSFSVVADGWAEAEQSEDKTAVPVVRMPETKPAKAELLTPAQKRQIWEKSRYEALRQQPDAMAFHEEALARFEQDGMLKILAKTNGLTEDEARRVWSVFLEHHRIRTTAQAAGGRAEIEECPEADSDIEGKDALQTAKPSAQPESDEKEAENDRPPIQITKMPTPPLAAVSTEQTSEPATTENITPQPLREESVETSEKQDTKELRYRINDEIAQQELTRTQAAAAELASQADDEIRRARWSSVKTVTNRTAMGLFALGLLGAGAMALNVWDRHSFACGTAAGARRCRGRSTGCEKSAAGTRRSRCARGRDGGQRRFRRTFCAGKRPCGRPRKLAFDRRASRGGHGQRRTRCHGADRSRDRESRAKRRDRTDPKDGGQAGGRSMKRAVVLTGLLTGISVVAFAAPAACPTCADTEKSERGVDIVVANTAPVAEPDWEVLLQSRVREADRLGLLRKAQRETADNMKRHAETPVDLKLPRAKATESRRLVLLDEASVRAMAEPVKAVFAGFVRGYVFFDADDEKQLAFVRDLPEIGTSIRPVATAGNVSQASRRLEIRLYADQGGTLTRRFALKSVPSVVILTFDGREVAAVIDEVALNDDTTDNINPITGPEP